MVKEETPTTDESMYSWKTNQTKDRYRPQNSPSYLQRLERFLPGTIWRTSARFNSRKEREQSCHIQLSRLYTHKGDGVISNRELSICIFILTLSQETVTGEIVLRNSAWQLSDRWKLNAVRKGYLFLTCTGASYALEVALAWKLWSLGETRFKWFFGINCCFKSTCQRNALCTSTPWMFNKQIKSHQHDCQAWSGQVINQNITEDSLMILLL